MLDNPRCSLIMYSMTISPFDYLPNKALQHILSPLSMKSNTKKIASKPSLPVDGINAHFDNSELSSYNPSFGNQLVMDMLYS